MALSRAGRSFALRCARDVLIVAIVFYLVGVLLFDNSVGDVVGGFVVVAILMTLGNVMLRRSSSAQR